MIVRLGGGRRITLVDPQRTFARFERMDGTTVTDAELDAVLSRVNRGDFEGAPSHPVKLKPEVLGQCERLHPGISPIWSNEANGRRRCRICARIRSHEAWLRKRVAEAA